MLDPLEQRVQHLEDVLNKILLSDKYLFQKPLIGGANGLRIGSKTKDKIGFYNAAPIYQPSSTGTRGKAAVGGDPVNDEDTFAGLFGSTAYTIGDIVLHLKQLGLLAL